MDPINCIENLDVKTSLSFLPFVDNDYKCGDLRVENVGGISIIDKLLSDNECDTVINNCEKIGFVKLPFRNSERIIGLDSDNNLLNTIAQRLSQNNILDKINANPVRPYGFNSYNVDWQPNSPNKINPCFRVNKYHNVGFADHRDAQLTVTQLVKSNYSMLIYLNDSFEDGETVFTVSDKEINDLGAGLTAAEELKELKKNNTNVTHVTIKPVKGMCVIFDQRILHHAKIATGDKYVLRTDLIVTGTYKKEQINTPLLTKLEDLTKKIFRQAQYNELNNLECSHLYEICLSLRQHPELLTVYPEHLEQLITVHNQEKLINSNLTFQGRSGYEYKFKFDTKLDNKFELVKICTIFAICSLTNDIDEQFMKNFNHILDSIKINKTDDVNSNYFTKSVGDYNLINFDQLSKEWISELVKHVRIKRKARGIHKSRYVFDLITSITNKPTATNKQLITKDEKTQTDKLYNIVPLMDFSNKYNIDVYSVLNKLFSVKLPSMNCIDRNIPIVRPLSVLATFYTCTCNIHISEHTCGNCWHAFYKESKNKNYVPKYVDNPNAIGIYGMKFTIQRDEYVINIHNVTFGKDINTEIKGQIKITAPTGYFNHAACGCYHMRNCSLKETDIKKYVTIEHDINFIIKDDNIFLQMIPNVVL